MPSTVPDDREQALTEIEDMDDGWSCTFCGGDGYCEVDDPLWDDCDEFGWGDCSACGGTGERKYQTVF